MPIVHPCRAPNCDVLTMGTYCVQHEHLRAPRRRRVRTRVEQAATAGFVVGVALAAALIRSRVR